MLLVAGIPSILVITSSARSPAVAAGPPGVTAWTKSPSGSPAWAAAAGGIGTVCRPKKAWVTRPVAMISSAMDLARSTGMAKPSPMLPPPEFGTAAPAVGTPTSWPSQLTRAPPLLPGLMEASVCSADTSNAVPSASPGTSTVRSRALMMPDVTVPDSPSGAPIATTGWPTFTDDDEPSEITLSWREVCTWSTARSVCGSRPVIVAGAVCPSANSTPTEPPLPATAMTWLLVKMYPSDRMISPDPVPPPPPLPLAEIVTTEGMTWSATEITLQALTWADPAELDGVLAGGDAEDFVAATITPPITPPTTNAAPSAAHGNHPRLSRPCFDPLMSAPCYLAVGILSELKHAGPSQHHPPWVATSSDHDVCCRVAGSVPGVPAVAESISVRGMRIPSIRPMTATTIITVKATANGFPSGNFTATRTEPTRAVPSDDPRFETLRDRPEISPWSASGKLDWTTLTEEVNMVPTPMPNSSSPGIHRQTPACARTRVSSKIIPAAVITKPAMISHRCGCRRANRSAAADATRIPIVPGVSTSPVLIALYPSTSCR